MEIPSKQPQCTWAHSVFIFYQQSLNVAEASYAEAVISVVKSCQLCGGQSMQALTGTKEIL